MFYRGLRVGDWITARTRHGAEVSGKVSICCGTHVVLNIGGRYGKPLVVDDNNFVRHGKKKK
jgi:hypothetical protein